MSVGTDLNQFHLHLVVYIGLGELERGGTRGGGVREGWKMGEPI